MNNEEKILQLLTQMQSDISDLKEGQVNLEHKVDNLEQVVLRMEHDHGQKITALFDSYSINLELTKQMEPRVTKLEKTVKDHTLQLYSIKSSVK